MISSVLMIGLAIALIRAYARFKSTGGHGKVLVLLLGSALIAVAVGSSWVGSRPPPEQFEPSEWNRALGEMLGRQASKLVPEGGKVLVFVSPQVMARRDQRLRVARVDQLQGLKIGLAKNLNITVIEPQDRKSVV